MLTMETACHSTRSVKRTWRLLAFPFLCLPWALLSDSHLVLCQSWLTICLSRRGKNTTEVRLKGFTNKRTRFIKRKYSLSFFILSLTEKVMLRRWCHKTYLILCFSLPTPIKMKSKSKNKIDTQTHLFINNL